VQRHAHDLLGVLVWLGWLAALGARDGFFKAVGHISLRVVAGLFGQLGFEFCNPLAKVALKIPAGFLFFEPAISGFSEPHHLPLRLCASTLRYFDPAFWNRAGAGHRAVDRAAVAHRDQDFIAIFILDPVSAVG
jgi:hypothetical protein